MKLKQLFESSEFDLKKFLSDIQFFIDQHHKGKPQILFHGTSSNPREWEIKTFTPRSAPRDSPKDVHNGVNKFFEEKFGFPFRNGLFVTTKRGMASQYGRLTAIFPIGRFEWLYSPQINDLTVHFGSAMNSYVSKRSDKIKDLADLDNAEKEAAQKFPESLSKYQWNHNVKLEHDNPREMMIKCDKFYMIDYESELFVDIMNAIKGELNDG